MNNIISKLEKFNLTTVFLTVLILQTITSWGFHTILKSYFGISIKSMGFGFSNGLEYYITIYLIPTFTILSINIIGIKILQYFKVSELIFLFLVPLIFALISLTEGWHFAVYDYIIALLYCIVFLKVFNRLTVTILIISILVICFKLSNNYFQSAI
ncbi:hypothetical protein [Runella sp.]|uniref:hypothetical protein n=1 Tax=Runella sp. TaxID=1960881 RepID=UPI003D0F1F18